MQLASEGECELCPRGTYRTQGVEPACQKCPSGRTTPKIGATTIEECSLPVCSPGIILIYYLFIRAYFFIRCYFDIILK